MTSLQILSRLIAVSAVWLIGTGIPPNKDLEGIIRGSESIGPALRQAVVEILSGDKKLDFIAADFSRKGVQFEARDGKLKIIVYPGQGREVSKNYTDFLAQVGLEITFANRRLVEAFADLGMIAALSGDSNISLIELPRDYSVRGNSFSPSTPAQRPADVDDVFAKLVRKTRLKRYWLKGYRGEGISVGVIDRGFRDLDKMIAEGRITPIPEARRFNFVDTDGFGLEGPDTPDSKHGTATLEVIASFAPKAELYAIRSLGYTGQFARAIEKVKELKLDFFLVNMGFAGYPDGQSPFSLMMADAYSRKTLPIGSINNQALSYTGYFRYQGGFTTFGDEQANYIEILETQGRPVNVYLDWEPGKGVDLSLELYRKEGDSIVYVARADQVGSGSHLQCWEQIIRPGMDHPVVRVMSKTIGAEVRFRLLNMDLWSRFSIINSATTLTAPADARNTLTVGAVRAGRYKPGGREFYSSYGPTADGRIKPDIMGASRLWSYTWGGEFFGTSCSTPMVAGHLAVYKSGAPRKGSRLIWKAMEQNAILAGAQGKDNSFGAGLLRLPKPMKKKNRSNNTVR